MSNPCITCKQERAAVLVGVLWLVLILGMLLLGLNRQVQLASSQAQGQLDAVRAHWLARAGVERAMALLADDATSYDSPTDFWYDDPLTFEDIELAEGFSFRVTAPPGEGARADTPRFGLDDEASRINLSRPDRELLSRIDRLDASYISPIIDWVDNNEEAEPGGAEAGYYQHLNLPYEIRNGPMRTGRELLLVRGITPEAFFAEDTDADGLLDRRENDGNTTQPPDNADGTLDRGINGLATVYSYERNKTLEGDDRINLKNTDASTLTSRLSITKPLAERIIEKGGQYKTVFDLVGEKGEGECNSEEGMTNEVTLEWLAERYEQFTLEDEERLTGRVNVNTAARDVLEAIPGFSPSVADVIVERRASSEAFASLGELLTTGTLTDEQFQEAADYLTVRSNVMTIRSTGTTPLGASRTIVAVVDRGGDSPSILYWWQSE